MFAVILAGGRGTRMPESEKHLPKSLIDVAGKTILARQIAQLERAGITDIRLSLGHRADQVVEWLQQNGHHNVSYVIEQDPRGTGGGVKLAVEGKRGPFIMLCGDILGDFNFSKIIERGAVQKKSVLAGIRVPNVEGFSMLEYTGDRTVTAYNEKVASGIPGVTNGNASLLWAEDFTGMPEVFSMERDFFPKLIAAGKLVLHEHGGYWFDCGTEARLARVRHYFTEHGL